MTAELSIVISYLEIVVPVEDASRKAFLTVALAGFCTWTTPEALFVPMASVERVIIPVSVTKGAICASAVCAAAKQMNRAKAAKTARTLINLDTKDALGTKNKFFMWIYPRKMQLNLDEKPQA